MHILSRICFVRVWCLRLVDDALARQLIEMLRDIFLNIKFNFQLAAVFYLVSHRAFSYKLIHQPTNLNLLFIA